MFRQPFRLTPAFLSLFSIMQAMAAPGPAPNPPAVTFEIAAPPAWVLAVKADHSVKDADEGGISYLLLDRQDNAGLQASYYHETRRVTSENGVQNGASVT